MANWDSVINNRMTMGRGRSLCLAMNALKRRREAGEEERRLGVIPFLGRGIALAEPILNQERIPGRNGKKIARGRSRSYPAPPPNIFRSQPYSQPCCLAAGLGYVASNACLPSRINPLSWHTSNSPCPCSESLPLLFPPLYPSQNQNDTESTPQSSDSEEGDSQSKSFFM